MSGFNLARVEVLARREGISFPDACRRAQRASVAARQRKKREAERVLTVRAQWWWRRDNE